MTMKKNETRNYKQFIKGDKALREDVTAMQQKGGVSDIQSEREVIKQHIDENQEKKNEQKTEQNQKRSTEAKTDNTNYVKEKQKKEQHTHEMIEHDMRDQALGQIYKIPGADLDYDELSKMAQNNIRDASEVASESLQNDGFKENVEEVKAIMSEADTSSIKQLNYDYDIDVIAQAYIEIAKEASSTRDILRLERISDACNFSHPAYERQFDYIRQIDKEADRVLDRLDMEIGLER